MYQLKANKQNEDKNVTPGENYTDHQDIVESNHEQIIERSSYNEGRNNYYRGKVLLSGFHGHTTGFHPQTKK